jgi:hypothetical protein
MLDQFVRGEALLPILLSACRSAPARLTRCYGVLGLGVLALAIGLFLPAASGFASDRIESGVPASSGAVASRITADAPDASDSAKVRADNASIRIAQRSSTRPRPRGRGRGGYGGISAGGIGAIIIQEAIREGERNRRRERESERDRRRTREYRRERKRKRVRIRAGKSVPARTKRKKRRIQVVCRDGWLSRRTCRCRKGRTRVRIRTNVYSCNRIARLPEIENGGDRRSTIEEPVTTTGRPIPPLPPRRTVSHPTVLPPIAIGERVPDTVPDEIIVVLPRSVSPALASEIANTHGLTVLETQPSALLGQSMVRMQTLPNQNTQNALNQLQNDPRVLQAQPNYVYQKPAETTSASTNNLQYALTKIGLPADASSANGSGIVIAVIDSGVDVTHPDLANVVAKKFDAIGDRNPKPDNHGTAVAGIISGHGLVRGVAPGASLLDVRAFKSIENGRPRLATSFVLLRGIEWALTEQARILNLSFAGPQDPLLLRAIRLARSRDVILVAAAGNEGPSAPPVYPAAYDEVIAVTAIDPADALYAKANRGRYIAIAAPGVDILAPTTSKAHNLHTGTSFAAAHVSGIFALMLQRAPKLTSDEALGALISGARDLGRPGRDDEFGAGGADAGHALARLPARAVRKP